MPYLFTCPHCQTKTEVEDRYSGQTGQCVTCGGQIQLPQFSGTFSSATASAKATGPIRWIVAAVVVVILLACFVFAAIRFGGGAVNRLTANRERSLSIKNLEKIAKALNAYAADHGSYPPPASRDANNVKLHSWRVMILPYLGEEALYNDFRLDVPWSDPDNMSVATNMPAVYRHPDGNSSGLYLESAYYLIVGPGTLFPAAGPLGPERIVDDPSQTILLIEGTPLVPSGMWTEPIDLEFAKMSGQIGSNPGIDPGGLFEDGAAMATVDGRGHFVPDSMMSSTFRALVTPSGGERMADDTLD
jgi:hypothetical protein